MKPNARTVLIVADDRATLRRLSKFLELFGYNVKQAADVRQARVAGLATRDDIVILDWDPLDADQVGLCRTLRRADPCCYIFALIDPATSDSDTLVAAIEAGVDDFLAEPVIHGELLSRLRAGAESVDRTRTEHSQTRTDSLTGLTSRVALKQRIQRELGDESRQTKPPSCAVVDLDFLRRVNLVHGEAGGDVVLKSVATKLGQLCGENHFLAKLEGDRFCVLFTDSSRSECSKWAEEARLQIEQLETTFRNETVGITASVGLSSATKETNRADQLIASATQAVETAKSSGRNCVVWAGEFDTEARTLHELAAAGRVFEDTLARDVMTNCSLILPEETAADWALEALRRARLEAAPVVNAAGELQGLATLTELETALEDSTDSSTPVVDLAARDVPSCHEATTFQSLFESFVEGAGRQIVVLDEGRPTGLIVRDTLAELIEPSSSSVLHRAGAEHSKA